MAWEQTRSIIRLAVGLGTNLNTAKSRYRIVKSIDALINSDRYGYHNEFGLVVAGLFTTDPALGYPPGVPMPTPQTTHGTIHGLAGLVVFLSPPAACFVLARRFAGDPRWRGGQPTRFSRACWSWPASSLPM